MNFKQIYFYFILQFLFFANVTRKCNDVRKMNKCFNII